MSRDSILPDHPTDFWLKRWVLGGAVALCAVSYGLYAILTQQAYAYEYRHKLVAVSGGQAMLVGLFFLGLGLALFSNYHAPYSRWCAPLHHPGTCLGLVLCVIGIVGAEFAFLF
jgi:hypothetical protein